MSSLVKELAECVQAKGDDQKKKSKSEE